VVATATLISTTAAKTAIIATTMKLRVSTPFSSAPCTMWAAVLALS
jgi:hypothetical protein